MNYRSFVLLLLVSFLFAVVVLAVAVDDDVNQQRGKEALAELQEFVGEWKGAGQLRRGSTKGGWIEENRWVWQYDQSGAAIVLESKKGKFLTHLELRAGMKTGEFTATGKTPKEEILKFTGKVDDQGRLLLTNPDKQNESVARISIRTVADGKRMVITYERLLTGTLYGRMGEIGSTRKGSMFGVGGNQIVCIVSGGKGTMPVTFDGKTYYVCCTGCRDYFNDNAAAVIADYKANK